MNWKPLWPYAIGAALCFGLGFRCGRGKPQPEPPIVAILQDSILNERARYSSDSAQIAAHVRTDIEAADAMRARSLSQRANSAKLRQNADSLAALGDTARAFIDLKVAYDSLDAAFANVERAYQSQVLATSAALAGWARADSQLTTERRQLTQQVVSLQGALAKSQRPVTFTPLLIGLALGAVVGAVLVK